MNRRERKIMLESSLQKNPQEGREKRKALKLRFDQADDLDDDDASVSCPLTNIPSLGWVGFTQTTQAIHY